jgi:hypothetical protein
MTEKPKIEYKKIVHSATIKNKIQPHYKDDYLDENNFEDKLNGLKHKISVLDDKNIR